MNKCPPSNQINNARTKRLIEIDKGGKTTPSAEKEQTNVRNAHAKAKITFPPPIRASDRCTLGLDTSLKMPETRPSNMNFYIFSTPHLPFAIPRDYFSLAGCGAVDSEVGDGD
jgi:hypothetical protein